MKKVLIFLIVGFLILFVYSFAQAQPSGKIAFVKGDEQSNNPNIWLINADGSQAQQITTDNDSGRPCWFYDGRLVIGRRYQTHPNYGSQKFPTEIWAMNPDGSGLEKLLTTKSGTNFTSLTCSPKEPKIAYTVVDEIGSKSIYIFEVGETPEKVYSQKRCGSPSFSSDGQRILFTKEYQATPSDDPHDAIFSIALDGTDEKLVFDDPMNYHTGPIESPNGRHLAFYRSSSRNVGIHDQQYLMLANADGSAAKTFRPDFGGADKGYARWDTRLPDFSPDSKYLVFEVHANKVEPEATPETSNWEQSIWVASIEDGKATKIADDGYFPAWQKVEAKTTAETAKEGVVATPSQKSTKPTAKDVATGAAIGAIFSAAFTLIMSKVTGIKGKPGAGGLIKLAVYALAVFAVATVASIGVAWKIRSSQNIVPPTKTETESAQPSEQPDTAKFKEYFSDLYLAKPPAGVEIPSSFEAIKTTTFSLDERLCILGNANKIIDTGKMADAIYDVTNKKYVKEKSPLNITGPVPTGAFTEECKPITFPAGKYERKIYVNDVLVAVLPFEVH